MTEVLICGGVNVPLVKEVRRVLSESKPWVIRGSRYFSDSTCTDFTPDRDHGWYRKFEKKSKKSKFK